MQDKLIIYLQIDDKACPGWVTVDSGGIVKESVYRGGPDELIHALSGKRVMVIVRPEAVLLTSVSLPDMNRSRLRQALPYALEEELVGDVETQYFACGERLSDGSMPLAVVAKQIIEEWLSLLKSWGVEADTMMPMTLALPLEENAWHIVVFAEMACVRTGLYSGFACDLNNLRDILKAALSATAQPVQHIHVHNYTSHAFAKALNLKENGSETFRQPDQLYQDMASWIDKPAINLLQGSYQTSQSYNPLMRTLTNAVLYLGMAWVLILFLYPTVSWFILRQQAASVTRQIETIYKRHFPEASSMVAPKLRMEEKLKRLSRGGSQQQLLLLLGQLGRGMQKLPGIRLNKLNFQYGLLTVELIATSSDDFDRFMHFLTEQGVRVKQDNANLVGDQINATLVLE